MSSINLTKITRTFPNTCKRLPKLHISLSSGSQVDSISKLIHRRRNFERSLKEKKKFSPSNGSHFPESSIDFSKKSHRLSHSGSSAFADNIYRAIRSAYWNGEVARFHSRFAQTLKTH